MASSEVYLWSRLLALRRRSTALSKSLLFNASAPSRASLFASLLPFACFPSLPPCACAIWENPTVKATIRVRAEYFFITFLLDLDLSREFETHTANSWPQAIFTFARAKALVQCRSLARPPVERIHLVPVHLYG